MNNQTTNKSMSTSSYRLTIIDVSIFDSALYNEVKEFLFTGMRALNRGLPNERSEYKVEFYGDDFREARELDDWSLSNRARAVLMDIKLSSYDDYYDADRVILRLILSGRKLA